MAGLFYLIRTPFINVSMQMYIHILIEKDYGDKYMNLRQESKELAPYIVDVERMSERNNFFRVEIWTGKYSQMTLMSIPIMGDIGEEIHDDTDQIIRVEHGMGVVQIGRNIKPEVQQMVSKGDVIFIPAGTWHNIYNKGRRALKLSSIYSPPQHSAGTIHRIKEESEYK